MPRVLMVASNIDPARVGDLVTNFADTLDPATANTLGDKLTSLLEGYNLSNSVAGFAAALLGVAVSVVETLERDSNGDAPSVPEMLCVIVSMAADLDLHGVPADHPDSPRLPVS